MRKFCTSLVQNFIVTLGIKHIPLLHIPKIARRKAIGIGSLYDHLMWSIPRFLAFVQMASGQFVQTASAQLYSNRCWAELIAFQFVQMLTAQIESSNIFLWLQRMFQKNILRKTSPYYRCFSCYIPWVDV